MTDKIRQLREQIEQQAENHKAQCLKISRLKRERDYLRGLVEYLSGRKPTIEEIRDAIFSEGQ